MKEEEKKEYPDLDIDLGNLAITSGISELMKKKTSQILETPIIPVKKIDNSDIDVNYDLLDASLEKTIKKAKKPKLSSKDGTKPS